MSGSFRNGTIAGPSVEAIGDRELESVVKPGAFDEDGGAFVLLRVGWYFELQACVPDCVHGAFFDFPSENANGGRLPKAMGGAEFEIK